MNWRVRSGALFLTATLLGSPAQSNPLAQGDTSGDQSATQPASNSPGGAPQDHSTPQGNSTPQTYSAPQDSSVPQTYSAPQDSSVPQTHAASQDSSAQQTHSSSQGSSVPQTLSASQGNSTPQAQLLSQVHPPLQGRQSRKREPQQVQPPQAADLPVAMQRLTPAEIVALAAASAAGRAGVQMTPLVGDPTKPGLYTVRVSIAPHTQVPAHTHRDNRAVTVVSGTWRMGYGDHFDANALKDLPPGSFYTEPAGQPHFSQTGDDPVVILVTGYGPSDTKMITP